MTPKEVRENGYQKPEVNEGISAAGRAFLEALVRRKRARGEELPPLYMRLLGGIPEAPAAPEGAGEAPLTAPSHPLPVPLSSLPPELLYAPGSLAQELPAPTTTPSSPLEVADRLLAKGEAEGALPPLSERALRVYRILLALGVARLRELLGERRPPKSLSQLTVFVPNDLLIAALGIPSASLYRALGELTQRGLISRRAWRVPATLRGKTGFYAAGTLYAVRLPHRSRRPRLEAEDFRHPWRDLEGDIERGKTAWRVVRESKDNPLKEDAEVLELLLGFALSPEARKTALAIDSLTVLLRAKPAERQRRVEELALGLAKEFKDPGSVKFYAWLLWGALRAEMYGLRPGALDLLAWAIARVREALAASWGARGKVRRPGALLAHLLKEQGLLSLLQKAPQWRVA
ncbi:hypothetical protein AN926_06420 [Thermus scotoductus]|uniref:Replication protein n=1 Tax=Thermus scotoductus TaxID=37636 RepID=A0A0N1KPD7_THESC|nr:hypothetical protein AN926_06420 [Thermus scotoductus]